MLVDKNSCSKKKKIVPPLARLIWINTRTHFCESNVLYTTNQKVMRFNKRVTAKVTSENVEMIQEKETEIYIKES